MRAKPLILDIIQSDCYNVQKYVLLSFLFKDSGGTKQKVDRLITLWRHRLYELRQAGWQTTSDKRTFAYMYNCQPAMVKTDFVTQYCSRRHICPFCYSRSVARVYQAITAGMHRYSDGVLITRSHQIHINSNFDIRNTTDKIRSTWPAIAANTLGAYFSIVLEPFKADIVMTIRSIMLINPKTILPKWISEDSIVHRDLTKHQLSKAVGTVLQYPKTLLYGDPALTCKILYKRENLRLAASHGCFRNRESLWKLRQLQQCQ